MDFLHGNDPEEWLYLGDSENAIPYEHVILNQHMAWKDFPLENFIAACAKFSGPIALIWNSNEPLPLNVDVTMSTDIFIFDSSGRKLARIDGKEWQHSRIITMGWTLAERLYVLFEDGHLYVYSIRGTKVSELKLFEQAFLDIVVSGVATENGCIAYTKTGELMYINCEDEIPTITNFPSLPMYNGNNVSCMCCIEGRFTETGDMSIIVACWDKTTYLVNENEIIDLETNDRFFGRFVRMALSPDRQYVACYTSEGWIVALSTSFDTKIFEFNTHSKLIPRSLSWCGGDSIVSYWTNHGMLMISPFCDYIRFDYENDEEPLFLINEIDCLRIYTRYNHEIIRRIMPALFNVYMPGSQSNGAKLRRSFGNYTNKACDVTMKNGLIDLNGDSLIEGIIECLEAAEDELSTLLQEELLRSAEYGIQFIQHREENSNINDEIKRIVKKLRVMNELRKESISLYLSKTEYDYLKEKAVLARLMSRKLYYLAVKICEYLSIPYDFVLVDWACEKVHNSSDISSTDLCCLIREKIGEHEVSYSQIAWSAYQAGRSDLACLLVQYEHQATDRVPLFLLMNEEEKACNDAITSNDADLILFTGFTLHLKLIKEKITKDHFIELMKSYPPVFSALCVYIKANDMLEYESLLQDCGKLEEYCNIIFMKAFQKSDLEQRIQYFKNLSNTIQSIISSRKDLDFINKMITDEIKLLGFQTEVINLVKEKECVNMSVVELIKYCILKSQLKLADKIRNTFKIPDKQYWYMKIQALAEGEYWDVLKAFGNEKKSPIGYRPFVEVCLTHLNEEQASIYLPKIRDTKERLQLSLKCKAFTQALSDAAKLKDVEALCEIVKNCEDPIVRDSAEKQIEILTTGRK